MSGRGTQPVSNAAYALLGAMSAITFGGPLGLAWLLSGGERRGWPPDRTVACLTVRRWLLKPSPRDESSTGP